MFRKAYSQAKRTANKATRRVVTRWYVVDRLLELVRRSVPPSAVHLPKLDEAPAIGDEDLWRAIATFATWFVREAETVRVATLEEVWGTPRAKRKPPPNFNRKGRRARLSAYLARRSSATHPPEGRRNDPLVQLQEELGKSMAKGGASAKLARLALDRTWAGALGRNFGLPSPDNVVLLLSILVQLLPHAHVRDADLDSGVEPFLDGVLLELTRLHIGALLSAQPSAGIGTALIHAFAQDLSVRLSCRPELENQSQTIDLVQQNLEQLALIELQSAGVEIGNIFSATNADRARQEADKLAARTTAIVVRQFAAQHSGVTTEPSALHSEWSQQDMQALCNAAVSWCQPFAACSPVDVTSEPSRTAATLIEMFLERYDKKLSFSIAVPTTLVAAAIRKDAPGVLTRADTLRSEWGMPNVFQKAASRTAKEVPSTILLHYPTVVAHTRNGAVEWARRASAAEASLLWLALGARTVLDIFEPIHARAHHDGETYKHFGTSRDVVRPPAMTATNVRAMNTAIEKVRVALSSKKTAGTMSRVLSAAMFAHMATQSEHPHERYLYLWLSLEALFSGLENDTDEYERVVPIGTRVAYRCALMLDPDKRHVGRTHGQFRWGITMELQGLYKLRNSTVHSGQYAPVVNKLLEQRWRTLTTQVASRTMVAVLERGATTVEEVLAFREDRFPAGATIT
ncbi:MAG TPA: hypothetical protein VGC79_37195 [Polyangiaceae bacterium]